MATNKIITRDWYHIFAWFFIRIIKPTRPWLWDCLKSNHDYPNGYECHRLYILSTETRGSVEEGPRAADEGWEGAQLPHNGCALFTTAFVVHPQRLWTIFRRPYTFPPHRYELFTTAIYLPPTAMNYYQRLWSTNQRLYILHWQRQEAQWKMAQERRMKAERDQLQAQMALLRVEADHAVVSGTSCRRFRFVFSLQTCVYLLYIPHPIPSSSYQRCRLTVYISLNPSKAVFDFLC